MERALQRWLRYTYDHSSSVRSAVRTARTLKFTRRARGTQPPFAGDRFLTEAVDHLIRSVPVTQMVETGTYLGHTTRYLAVTHPELRITTVESHPVYYRASSSVLRQYPNVVQIGSDSATVLRHLFLREQRSGTPLFFLDAHWADLLPLRDEIRLIGAHLERAIMVIHDFQVPDHPHFRFDVYGEDAIGPGLLRETLDRGREYQVLLPRYAASEVHPDPSRASALRGYAIVFQGMPEVYDAFVRSPLGARYDTLSV